MKSGKLRHRVTFQSLTSALDSDGATVETWTDFFSHKIWAEITYLSGRELIASESVHSKIIARIVVRYRDDFVPSMRILYRDKIFNIEAILPDLKSGKQYLTMMVYSGLNEG